MAIWDFLNGQGGGASGFSPLSAEHRQRQELFGLFWNYYRGKHRRQLKTRADGANDNVIVNYSRRVVDKSLAFLFGGQAAPAFEIEDEENEAAEAYLRAAWGGTDEERAMLLQEIGLNGSVTGMAFVRLYAPERTGELPRIVALNSSLMEIITHQDDIDLVVSYRIVWRSGEDWRRHRIDLQENGEWLTTEEVSERGGAGWRTMNEVPWPYTWAPVFWCQNRPNPIGVWGISDLEEADINDAINFTASNISRILRYHAHPRTIGTGFSAPELQNTAVDQFWSIPKPDARVFNLEMQSDLVSAYQFWAGLREAYSKITGVPDLDPDRVNVGQLSGFALRILYGDLLELTNVKRNTYGEMLSAINGAIVEMGGFGQGVMVRNRWGDPLPVDEGARVQGLSLDRQQGLSLETYLEQRGYDPARELGRIQTEQASRTTLGEELLRSFERGGQP
jgi:hypothetical protein